MCDCYAGCWRDHARDQGWTSIPIPQALIDEKRQAVHYHAEQAAAMEIVRSEGIPYGDYIVDGGCLIVNPDYREGTKGTLAG